MRGVQYLRLPPIGTIGPVVGEQVRTYSRCPAPAPREFTISIFSRGQPIMTKDLVSRTRRIVLTVGPLVAIALSLAAGWKW